MRKEKVLIRLFGRAPKRAVKPAELDSYEKREATWELFSKEVVQEKEFKLEGFSIKAKIIRGHLPYVGKVQDVFFERFDFDAVRPAYKNIPHHVWGTEYEEEFKKLFEETQEISKKINELERIDARFRYIIRFNSNVSFAKGLAYLNVLKEYNREQAQKLKKALSEVKERERKVRELSKELRKLNKKLKELSKKAYKEYQRDIEEGMEAFYRGDFDEAIEKLGWDKFEKVVKEEFNLKWVKVLDARGAPWRAVLAIKVDLGYNSYGEKKILPTGRIFLMGFDDNEEKWFLELREEGYPYELEYLYRLTVPHIEAIIFHVDLFDIQHNLVDRQGDVLILRAREHYDFSDAEEATEIVITSKHVLKSEKPFRFIEKGNKTIVQLSAPAVLEHPEHHNVKLEPGTYVFATASIPEAVD